MFQAFKEFKIFVEKQTGRNIKSIQTDNGREYVNREFDEFLKKNGIAHRLTVTHTPQQNGIAERKNRTLVEMARCLLIQSNLSPSFWGEAINTANYIRNRCPTNSLNGKTPFEMWTGKIPYVGYFREFGCPVYSLNREPNKKKFEERSKKGIFIGYDEKSKAYRIWLPKERRIDISRDVKFLDMPKMSNETPNVFDSTDKEIYQRSNEIVEFESIESPNNNENNENCINEEENEERNQQNEVQVINIPVNEKRGPGRLQIIRTGSRGRPKKRYHLIEENKNTETTEIGEISFKKAMSGPEADEWLNAMTTEMESIIKNNTWKLVNRPEQGEVIGSRFVLTNKLKKDGNLERRKARIVARGFAQIPGVDFDQTFAPVARINSIRVIIALAMQHNMHIKHLDVETAYLNGELEEQIFMEVPTFSENVLEEIITSKKKGKIVDTAIDMLQELRQGNKVCHLNKALYGLRQAGRRWHIKLSEVLTKFGLKRSTADPCIFSKGKGKEALIAVIYVDDILIASNNESEINKLTKHLASEFQIKDLGEVKYCLGIEFTRNKMEIKMNQKVYIENMLEKFGMKESKPVSTPMDCNVKLKKAINESENQNKDLPFRELVGSLMYLAVCTRPDIAYAVSNLSQFSNCYDKSHWTAAKRVLRYLKGTSSVGLYFKMNEKGIT